MIHPALADLARVAGALGSLRDRVVFVGGAIAPLLQEKPPFPRARPTSDVDALLATASYADANQAQQLLTSLGFRRDLADPQHAHRWLSPDGIPFDLVPVGEHLGASESMWDAVTIATAVEVEIEAGLSLRYASGPAFLALKWSAYHDRGRDDPLASRDLEDILALLASRPGIVAEVTGAPEDLRSYVAEQARALLAEPRAEDLLAAHLNNAVDLAHTVEAVRNRLRRLAGR